MSTAPTLWLSKVCPQARLPTQALDALELLVNKYCVGSLDRLGEYSPSYTAGILGENHMK